jgi:nucleotide-binding universal stress UspA family protein
MTTAPARSMLRSPDKETAMFSRIVVGVDGRSGGEDAIALACQLADSDAELVLCEVVVVEDVPSRATNRDYEAVTLDDVRARLAAACARVDDAVVSARVKVASSVAQGLCDVGGQAGADLIVVGSCHRGPIGRLLAGNDANATLRNASCPVALAPRGYADNEAVIDRIGVGYSESIESDQALALAIARALRRRARGDHAGS